jgi:osmotically-inducible protein OsmY
MSVRTSVIAVAILAGCAQSPRIRPALPSAAVSPTQGTDTGALASDTTHPSTAWPGTRQADPAVGYVGPEPRPVADRDRDITRQIGAAVLNDRNLAGPRNVVITTHRGVVTIRGNVPSARARARILEDARRIPGVSDVNNELRVDPNR